MSRRDHYNRCPPCVTASLAAPALRRGYRSPAPRRSNSGGRSVGRTPADRATDRPPQVELSPATRPHYGPRPARDGAGGGRGSGGAPVGLRGSAGAGQQSITKPLPVETAPRTHGRPAGQAADSSRADIRVNCFKNYRTTKRRPGSRARDASGCDISAN